MTTSLFLRFLEEQTAVAQAAPIWQWKDKPLPLRQYTYLSPTLPPHNVISSARAILFRNDKVMVLHDHH